jgi:hypothetical protein
MQARLGKARSDAGGSASSRITSSSCCRAAPQRTASRAQRARLGGLVAGHWHGMGVYLVGGVHAGQLAASAAQVALSW